MFLLAADFPGRDELVAQAKKVKATGDCDCGCGTIDLSVDAAAPLAVIRAGPVPVEGLSKRDKGTEVLLFVRDGRLSMLEIVEYEPDHPTPYPRREDLEVWVPGL